MADAQQIFLSSYEWKAYPQYRDTLIMDPDGWDRTNDDKLHASMCEAISETEFARRLQRSTCMLGMVTAPSFVDADGRSVSDIAVQRFLFQLERFCGPARLIIKPAEPVARAIIGSFHSEDFKTILLTQPHDAAVMVEWDADYRGGDYSDVGTTILIPAKLVDAHDGDVKEAFRIFTQRDPICIVFYESERNFDMRGEEIEDNVANTPAPSM